MKTCKAADAPELPQRGRYLTVVARRAKSRASFRPRYVSYEAWETQCFTGRHQRAKVTGVSSVHRTGEHRVRFLEEVDRSRYAPLTV
jgi:hypothetical protein